MALSARMERMVSRWKTRTYVTYKDYAQQDAAARLIQQRWKRCNQDPSFAMCVRRLRREFADMSELI